MENILDSPYYRLTKRGLQCIGHWPFQSTREKRSLRCLTFIITISLLIPKIIKCIESLDDVDITIECIPIISCYILALIKFFNWIIMEDHLRRLLMTIERDWKSLTRQRDIEILHQYSDRGRKYNLAYTTFIYGTLLLYFCSPAVPKILDFFNPLNETRRRVFLFQTEYFIDQDKYYVQILMHAWITVTVATAYIVFFDNVFALFVNHACGRLEILRDHLETIHSNELIENGEKSVDDFVTIKRRIGVCSDIQTQTFQFIELLTSSYDIALLFVVGISMALIVFTGVVIVMKMSQPTEMIRIVGICLDSIFHLFWISWLGHMLMVQNDRVFNAAYQSEWYSLSERSQLMLIPLMMRSSKPVRCQLTAGRIYVMSMQSFGAALKTVASLFTILNSMR
ncbi:uncharacterized protein LOC107036612 isoform X2 [Diachasma alloeum]|uniref:uncharacterized protein LOC107036612 isoform X2 n=1 Tax=Diachasma alloeum TaxID=454923 RepID=UPI0010FBA290|nr:uncharacterized protein LOC107036612 isoform X2 [Diachasma alloeum]